MNAISSSVNKGAFKAAPKAGAVRRHRRPLERSETPQSVRSESVPLETGAQEAAVPQDAGRDHEDPLVAVKESQQSSNATARDIRNADAQGIGSSRREIVTTIDRNSQAQSQNADTETHQSSSNWIPRRSLNQDSAYERGAEHMPASVPYMSAPPVVKDTSQRRTHHEESGQATPTAITDEPSMQESRIEDTRTPQDIKEEELSTRPQKRARTRRKIREPTPETAELEVIDRAELRMADLCKDLRKGKKSAKFEQFKKIEADRRRKQRQANARANAGEVSKDSDSQVDAGDNAAQIDDHDAANAGMQNDEPDAVEVEEEEEDPDDDEEQDLFLPDSGAPRTRVVNGEIVIDPTSLQVDRAIRDAVDEPIEYIEENPLERMVNSRTYSKRINSSRWDAESTLLFYDALSQWGTDFDMISRMFPGRNRKQIKSKFTIEERRNPRLVNAALINKKPVDLVEYSRMSEVEYKSVNQMQSELADLKTQFENEREEAMKEAQQRKAEMDEEQAQLSHVAAASSVPTKKSRRRDDDGLEIVGDNEEIEAEERRLEAERIAAMDSDNENA